ncbi:MAG: hypothetical protein LBN05_01325 [Oscillospiraceae bacterium]|jgi:hypothetical protein|nr:hypothetical protein [Oscillospiraceae bacterium]
MKNKFSKTKWILVFVSVLLIVGTFVSVAASLGLFAKYSNVDEKEFSGELSKYSFSELCDEINTMSRDGVDLSELQFHSVAIVEKAKKLPANDLQKIIEDERSSENLKVICIQALDFLAQEDEKYKLKDLSVLEALLLNEKASTLVRQNLVWVIPAGDKTNDIMETLIFQDDEYLAFQALKRLNGEAPDRARVVADTLIKTQAQNEKLRIAIQVISEQVSKSDDAKEKDAWVAYCMDVFKKTESSEEDLMRDTVVFALSDMFYANALYEIIQNDQIDDTLKGFSIAQNYQVLINVLENKPSQNDIEMAIKAMTIRPIDKTVEALKVAVSRSGEKYNLDAVLSQEAQPALEKWKDKMDGK